MAKKQPKATIPPGFWFDSEQFLQFCRDYTAIHEALDAEDDEALLTAVNAVFDEDYLPTLCEQWEEVEQGVLAWVKAQLGRPPARKMRFRRPDPNKRYIFMCKKCGERRGIHYYQPRCCSSCGGTQLVRKESNSPMAVPGSKLIEKMEADKRGRSQ